ncbi:hypothetical protein OF83DRAFT_1066836 [Amylostereum chailletii]|nr:hypothetical protein OF83DRAFT_1066836 [Amylostereum chailletii]
MLVGAEFQIPFNSSDGGGVWSQKYMDMEAERALVVIACCHSMAENLRTLGKRRQALQWLEEFKNIFKNMFFSTSTFGADWIMYILPKSAMFVQLRLSGDALMAACFQSLGNTGSTSHRLFSATHFSRSLRPGVNYDWAYVERTLKTIQACVPPSCRHPEPRFTATAEVFDPSLQISGSWKKLDLKKTSGFVPREDFASFVWKSRLYVCGGQVDDFTRCLRDFHYVDLNDLRAGWHKLPDYPRPFPWGVPVGWRMHVDESTDKAYVFLGFKDVDVFDLKTNTWSRITTSYLSPGSWPIADTLLEFGSVIYKRRIYAFGGTHEGSKLGCNLWLVLDLQTGAWRRLSGRSGPEFDTDFMLPGPRRYPALWADEEHDRIWMMFGDAERPGATLEEQPHGSKYEHIYDDAWSWNVNTESWRRERVSGNSPCPRTEMAVTYNPNLKRAFTFGGYNPRLPSDFSNGGPIRMRYTYFADTFMLDPAPTDGGASPAWKHVLTRGFPTYRAKSKLFVDRATGKMYLFGGYSSTEFIDDKKHFVSRNFVDLWQLRVDMPGGCFEDVDLEEEARTARVGQWQRCFSCGSAGFWKKCGGSCRGRVFFCDGQCLKDGWKEHKQRHGCSKR